MHKRLPRKRYILLFFTTLIVSGIFICNLLIERYSKGRLYTSLSAIPYNKTGLLLGTGKYLKGGQLNPYYLYRIEAASALIQAGKIKYLIISGDNSTANYDEPTDMRTDLIASGVDSALIYLDYAGFRTFDSMVRAREIFGQTALTVISQPFHNARAIYIAHRENINAIAFNAQDVQGANATKVQLREKFARVKVFIDYLVGIQPKFLGPPVIIPG